MQINERDLEMQEFDQRQLKLMFQKLEFCKSKKVSDDVSNHVSGLCCLLNEFDPDWKNEVLSLCSSLDYIYDIAQYEERKELSTEDQEQSKKIVEQLKRLIKPKIIENENE